MLQIVLIETSVMVYRSGSGVNRRAYVQVWNNEDPDGRTFENLTPSQYQRFQGLQNRMAGRNQTRAIYAENDGSPDEIANGESVWN